MNENNNNEQNVQQPEPVEQVEAPSVLEINVHDKVAGKSIGPGQR